MTATTLRIATVAAFDNHGSQWSDRTGEDAISSAEQEITDATGGGQRIDEWHVTDRSGCPMRVVRIADPEFLDTILAFA